MQSAQGWALCPQLPAGHHLHLPSTQLPARPPACRRFPAVYRRLGALLRLILLTYAYSMPIFSSAKVMHAFTPAPSTTPYLSWLANAYSLWLSTRIAFLGWAMVGVRPPLHLAVLYQLVGLWRIRGAGFCGNPVLQHPIMQDRTGGWVGGWRAGAGAMPAAAVVRGLCLRGSTTGILQRAPIICVAMPHSRILHRSSLCTHWPCPALLLLLLQRWRTLDCRWFLEAT